MDPAVGTPEIPPGAREAAPSAEAASGRSLTLAGRAGGRGMGGGWQGVSSVPHTHEAIHLNSVVCLFFPT